MNWSIPFCTWLRFSAMIWPFVLGSLPRPRMMLLVDRLQAVEREVRIDLRRRNIGVSEDRLHGSQICPVLHHVRRRAVAQHVRRGVVPDWLRRAAHDLPDALASQSSSANVNEHQRGLPFAQERRTPVAQIFRNGSLRGLSKRNNTLLISLAADEHVSEVEF